MTEYLELLPSWESALMADQLMQMPFYTATPAPTEVPTPEQVYTEEPTPEPVYTEEPTPEPVYTEEPTPEPVYTEVLPPEPVYTEVLTPEPVYTEAPTPEPVITEEPTPVPEEDLTIPLNTMLNCFGRTKTNVNFRSRNSRNGGFIRELRKGETV